MSTFDPAKLGPPEPGEHKQLEVATNRVPIVLPVRDEYLSEGVLGNVAIAQDCHAQGHKEIGPTSPQEREGIPSQDLVNELVNPTHPA